MLRPSSASLLACTLIAVLARADGHARPQLPIARRTLANGMTVVIAPDPLASSVHVALRFAGGAGDETAGEAGYTHLVEGLFADGTVHTKAGEHARRIEEVGGWTASQTTLDELVLSTEVPPEALDLALWLDAERMAGLADALTDASIAKERQAIAADYRAAYVDEPYALVTRAVRDALWPPSSANAHDILASPEALGRASVAGVRAFVRERIQPARATLVIAGPVTVHAAGELAQRYFEWIPRRDVVPVSSTTIDPLSSPLHRTVRDPIAEIVLAYRVPAAERRAPFEVLARMIAGMPGARLDELVDGKRATEIRAEVLWHARGGELVVHITPSAQLDRGGVEALSDSVRHAIGSLADAPPSEQLVARAGASWLAEHLLVLEAVAGRAATYPEWAAYDSLDRYLDDTEAAVRSLRSSDLSTLAQTWLAPSSALTVVGLPETR